MKKRRIAAAILAGVLMFTGVPAVSNPFNTVAYAETAKLAAPSGIGVASKTDTSIKLTWKKVSGADAYRVYKYDSSTGTYKTYKNVSGTICNVNGLKANTKYKFIIAALVKSGNTYTVQTKSSAVSVYTKAENKLAAPKNIKATTATDYITLSWDKINGADAYRIYQYDINTNKYNVYKNVSGTTCKVTGLSAGITYNFKIAALVKSGNSYKEQTRSGVIVVSTKANSENVDSSSQSKKDPIASLKFGMNSKDVGKLMDLSRDSFYDNKDYDTKCYKSTVKFYDIECEIQFAFNYKDELFRYIININNEKKYEECFSDLKKKYGYNFEKTEDEKKVYFSSLVYDYLKTIKYKWKIDDLKVQLFSGYDRMGTHFTVSSVTYENTKYSPYKS